MPDDPRYTVYAVLKVARNHSYLPLPHFFSLENIIHHDSKLYLVFEFMQMDLKKYLDSIPSGQQVDPMLLKVCHMIRAISIYFTVLELHVPDTAGHCVLPLQASHPP